MGLDKERRVLQAERMCNSQRARKEPGPFKEEACTAREQQRGEER